MRNLVRLAVSVVAAVAVLATAAIVVPVAIRGIVRHGYASSPRPLAPLTSLTETGSTVYAANGQVLATLNASVTRIPVKLSQVPKVLITAVLDTEDHRFYLHGAVDVPSEVRALLHDSTGGGLQGGSDITQQLVKQVYLTSERTLSRKIKEAFIAIRLQKLYTKNQILDAYLNTIYLGAGAYGVEAAARAYWNEPVSDVTLPQAAMLAGLIQDPSGYDPVTDPVLARIRRTQVLGRMLHYHDITAKQYDAANAAPLPTSQREAVTSSLAGIDGYYVAEVENELLGPGSPLGGTPSERYAEVFEGGLQIHTNLEPALQAAAVSAVQAITPPNNQGYQEALVSIDPHNGAVVAMVPGQNFATEKFNIVTQGLRQPGSGFKLFTLLPALEQGDSIFAPVDATSPCAFPFPGNDGLLQTPVRNDVGDGQSGPTTIQVATAQSLNCAFMRMGHQVGLPTVLATAEKLGVPRSELQPFAQDPSVVIGAASVSPLQMADAYATLADGGVYHHPAFIARIVDRTGSVIYRQPARGVRVIPQNIVGEADAAFQAVVQSGTGTAAQIPGREVAGKTGTNNGPTDAWFNGFTPQLEATVWMGYPPADSRLLQINGVAVYGGSYPAETVHAYLAAALANSPVVDFPPIDSAALPPAKPVPEVSGPFPGCAWYKGNPGYGACPPACTYPGSCSSPGYQSWGLGVGTTTTTTPAPSVSGTTGVTATTGTTAPASTTPPSSTAPPPTAPPPSTPPPTSSPPTNAPPTTNGNGKK